jgi:hypothetical protein
MSYGQVLPNSVKIRKTIQKYKSEIDNDLSVFAERLCQLLESRLLENITNKKFVYLFSSVTTEIVLCHLKQRLGPAGDEGIMTLFDSSQVSNLFLNFPTLYYLIKPLADYLNEKPIEELVQHSIRPKVLEYFNSRYDNNIYTFNFVYSKTVENSPYITINFLERFVLTVDIKLTPSTENPKKYELIPTDIKELQCDICRENKKNIGLSCGHMYCAKCLENIDRCPYCRKDITQTTQMYI